jgi:ATP/ADP translocase
LNAANNSSIESAFLIPFIIAAVVILINHHLLLLPHSASSSWFTAGREQDELYPSFYNSYKHQSKMVMLGQWMR